MKLIPKYKDGKPVIRRIKSDLPSKEELTNIITVIDQQKEDEKLANTSPQNLKHTAKVKAADERTKATSPSSKNIMEHIVTPIAHLYSPSTQFSSIIDALQGEKGYWEGIHYGNNGFVPDNWAKDNPNLTSGINMLADGLVYTAPYKIYKWGTTPKLIGNGAEFEVYSSPLSRNVTKFGSIPPEEIVLKNEVTGTIPMKYIGQTEDGLYGYTQRKAFVPKNFPNKKTMSKLYQRMVDNHWMPAREDSGMLDFVKLEKTSSGIQPKFAVDLGYGNIGFNSRLDWILNRTPVIIDNSLLDANGYRFLYQKKGGKLWG